jgi:hypothetical protein
LSCTPAGRRGDGEPAVAPGEWGTKPMDQCHSECVTIVTKDISEICYPMGS